MSPEEVKDYEIFTFSITNCFKKLLRIRYRVKMKMNYGYSKPKDFAITKFYYNPAVVELYKCLWGCKGYPRKPGTLVSLEQ